MAISTLNDYYNSKGQALPSWQSRAPIYAQMGLGSASSYTGSPAQNNALLGKLQEKDAQASQPAPTPAPAPPPPAAAPVAAPAPQVNVAQQVADAAAAATKTAKEYIDSLLPADKKIAAYTGKPVYGTTDAEYQTWLNNIALPYAEATYGKFFADQMEEYSKSASVATDRVDQDTLFTTNQLQTQLQDYLSKSQTDQQRMEQDYTQARDQEARNLGISLEALDTAKSRETQDTDRQLAQLQTDYQTSGGRISEDQAKTLGRLLTEYQTSTGRLTADQQTTLQNLDTDYGRILDTKTHQLAQSGLTFSGNRVKAENQIAADKTRDVTATNTQYGRQIGDVNQQYGYNTQDIQTAAERNLADLQTNYQRTTEGTQTSYERNLADLTRQGTLAQQASDTAQQQLAQQNVRGQQDIATNTALNTRDTATNVARQQQLQDRGIYDINDALRKQQLQNELDKQTQIETGYYGVGGQYDRASQTYSNQRANYYASQGAGGYY